MDLLKFLLKLLILVVFPLGELLRLTPINSISFSILDVVVFLIVIVWAVFSRKIVKNSFFWPLVVFVSIMILSLLYNLFTLPALSLISAFLYIIRWVLYLFVFYVFFSLDKSFKNRLLRYLSFSGFLIAVFGYVQFLLFPSLQSLYYLGWDKHLYRLFSTFLDPNFCGLILVLAFILNFHFLKIFKERGKIIIFLILQFVMFVAILLTYSRTALAALILSIVSLLIFKRKWKFIVVFVLFISFLIFLLPKTFKTEGTNFLRTNSIQSRISSIKDVLTIYGEHPILGVGFNALRYQQYSHGYINAANWEVTHAGAGTDNSFLFVLVTTGIVGLASYLFLWYSIFKSLAKKLKNDLALITTASCVAAIVGSLTINALFYPFIMLWLWIIIGITESS